MFGPFSLVLFGFPECRGLFLLNAPSAVCCVDYPLNYACSSSWSAALAYGQPILVFNLHLKHRISNRIILRGTTQYRNMRSLKSGGHTFHPYQFYKRKSKYVNISAAHRLYLHYRISFSCVLSIFFWMIFIS